MNVLITGVRTFWSEDLIDSAVNQSGFKVTKVISGLGAGVEYGALRWAYAHNVRTVGFDLHPYRNERDPEGARLVDMVHHSQAMIYIMDQKDRKSKKVYDLAKAKGIPIFKLVFNKEDWHGGNRKSLPERNREGSPQGVQDIHGSARRPSKVAPQRPPKTPD